MATCFFAVDIDADGVLHATGPRPRLVVGPLAACWRPVIAAWRAAGITVDDVTDPLPARWEKTILNATVGPLCLATGLGMAAVWADPDLRALTMAATLEGIAVALACGVHCAPAFPQQASGFFSAVGNHRPSVVADPGELPWVLGHLLRQAERHDLAVPALTQIATRVEAVVGGAVYGTARGVAART